MKFLGETRRGKSQSGSEEDECKLLMFLYLGNPPNCNSLKLTLIIPFSLKISVHALILLLNQLHSDKYFFRYSDDCHRESKYRISLLAHRRI